MGKAVEIKNLHVAYDDIYALENVNLTINEKDFLGIIGPNGGGKSTLLKSMLGIVKPSKGTIKIFGKSPFNSVIPAGYVPQFSGFDRNFPVNVQDTILTGRLFNKNRMFHKYNQKDREIAYKLMKKLGIYKLKDRQIGSLSGGQLQRVLIARALVIHPEILFLDEPAANVDTRSKSEIYQLLKELNKDITIIIATHNMGAVSTNIKSIACLNTRLYYHGSPEINSNIVKQLYGCNIDLIAHGVPHRVLKKHEEEYI